MSRQPIYLDNQSTTPLDPAVLDAMLPYFTQHYGNPHASEHIFGWQASSALERARLEVAELIGADKKEVIFTSGATESISLAILGLARSQSERTKSKIITVATEHSCVLETFSHMAKQGYEVVVLPVQADGLLDIADLKAQLDEKTLLVSVMLANNEIGVIQPLAEIAKASHEMGSLLHTDATQAVGKIPVDVETLGVDMLSASAHKLYGPKGVGALYVRAGLEKQIMPLTFGGGQEKGLRPGTIALPLVVGFGAAAGIAAENMETEEARILELRELLLQKLLKAEPELAVLGNLEERLSGNLSLVFPKVSGNSLVAALGERLAVSTGSSCSSVTAEPSHVLKALPNVDEAHAALRISIGRFNTKEEIEQAADLLLAVALGG